MSDRSNNPDHSRERLDPFGPVGPGETAPPGNETGAAPAEDADDQRLTAMLERATRPPADLKLDWDRLRSRLAAAPAGPRRAPPARRRRWQRILYVAGASFAAAAALFLTTLTLLHRPTDETPPPAKPPVQTAKLVVRFGVDDEQARELIDEPSRPSGAEIRVVFPRRRPASVTAAHPGTKGGAPIVLTGNSPLAGTPHIDEATDAEPDISFIEF